MTRYEKLVDSIEDIEEYRSPYGALRVVVWVTQVIAWLITTLHIVITAGVVYPFIRARLVEDLPTILLTLLFALIGLLFGIGILASAEIIELLMDMAKDVHLTRRYVRRFGLHMARDKPE